MSVLERRLSKFTAKKPEIVFEWKDRLSKAEGWLVINSVKNGAALAQTIIRKGITKEELEQYAKKSEIKLTISGPPVGGAAIGLNFDREDTRYQSIIERFFKTLTPILKSYCGVEAVENITANEIEMLCNQMGLLHPWEGIVEGYLSYTPDNKFKSTIRALQGFEPYNTEEKLASISRLQQRHDIELTDERFIPNPLEKFTVDEIIDGWGIAESVRHYYMIYGGFINNKFVLIQGWNPVAFAAAYFLCKYGALVVGILDESGSVINEKGMNHEDISRMYTRHNKNRLESTAKISFDKASQRFFDIPAEIFIAASPTLAISKSQAAQIIKSGIEVISCGTDRPFDENSYMEEIASELDSKCSVIHPIISKSGSARVPAFLLKKEAQTNDMAIIKDVSEIVRQSIMRLHQFNPRRTGIFSKALELSLTDLV